MFKDSGSEFPKFTNPNWDSEETFSHPNEVEIPEGKTGISIIDAANNLKKRIDDAEQRAKEAEENSVKDSLTGVYNFRFLDNYIKKFDQSKIKNPTVIIFSDINDLKSTNTRYGDRAGDELIKKTANFLTQNVRDPKGVVRKGGDEFVVLCEKFGNLHDFSKIITKRFDEKMSSDCQFAYGIVEFDPNQDKSLRDTVQRGDDLMKEKKNKQKSV